MPSTKTDKDAAKNIAQYNPNGMSLIIDDIYSSIALTEPSIGSIAWTMLSLVQHSARVSGTWLACTGGSCAGSAYATLTGNLTTPDTSLLITIGNVFIRVE